MITLGLHIQQLYFLCCHEQEGLNAVALVKTDEFVTSKKLTNFPQSITKQLQVYCTSSLQQNISKIKDKNSSKKREIDIMICLITYSFYLDQ